MPKKCVKYKLNLQESTGILKVRPELVGECKLQLIAVQATN